MKPEIIERDQLIIVGIRAVFEDSVSSTGTLWSEQVLPRFSEIKATEAGYYAAFNILPGQGDNKFEIVAGALTNSLEDIPSGMVSWPLPSGKYAEFTAKGLEGIKAASTDFLGSWLPTSGYQKTGGPMFAYTTGNQPGTPDTEWKINIPIDTPEALAELDAWLKPQ